MKLIEQISIKSKRKLKLTTEDLALDTIIAVSMLFVFLLTAYPFYFGLVLSFNNALDSARGGVYLWPRQFTLVNYMTFFNDPKWLNGFIISVMRTLSGTVITVLFTTLVAYGLSEKDLLFRKYYMALIVFSMYFSGGLIPYYITLRSVGLLNSFLVYIIPSALNLFFVFIAISFFQGIPKELRESALLDGASELTILRKIVLPISLPLVATMAIFNGVGQWNSWFDSAFFIKSAELRTLGYLLMEVINKANIPTNQQSAMQAAGAAQVSPFSIRVTAMMIAVLPILCIYPFLQKYFVTGLTIGAVKG